MEPTTRLSLVLRLRNPCDEAAWAEFVEIYQPLVYLLARNKGLQDADAQDLCQEVFRAVASAIERWDPDPAKGKFRAWLFRIARNLLVNFLASQRHYVRGSGSTSVQEMLEAQPAGDAQAEAEFQTEFQRRAFRWAAKQVKNEFTSRRASCIPLSPSNTASRSIQATKPTTPTWPPSTVRPSPVARCSKPPATRPGPRCNSSSVTAATWSA